MAMPVKVFFREKIYSKKIKFVDQSPNLKNNVQQVKELRSDEFEIPRKQPIGIGTQGKVYEGIYNKKQKVAVKVIPLYSKNTKSIDREIAILQSIKHPNFINLIGVC